MDWFGAGVNEPLIAVRAIHFGATAMTAGTVIFRTVVAKPALHAEPAAKLVRTQTLRVAWIGLAVTRGVRGDLAFASGRLDERTAVW